MRHLLIAGDKGVGRSTLLRTLMEERRLRPGGGFLTVMEPPDRNGSAPVYIHPVTGERKNALDNLVGRCKNQKATGYPAAFEAFVPRLREPAGEGRVVLMDEIGVMENGAPLFQQAVLELLKGDTPVLAVVRSMDTPFLNAVRGHPNACCLWLTRDNWEETLQRGRSLLAALEGTGR